MRKLKPQDKKNLLGLAFECLILCFIPLSHSAPMIFSYYRQDYFDARKIFAFFGFAIFLANLLIHLMLLFLTNKKRVSVIRITLRALTWALLIINIVENQVVYLRTSEAIANLSTVNPELTLTCSWIGLYAYGFLNTYYLKNGILKEFLICCTILYISIRISIHVKDPTPAVLGGLLCLIVYKFLRMVEKENKDDPEKESAKDKEIFLLKTLLADSDEGCIILQNEHNVFYTNTSAFTLLGDGEENIIANLEKLKSFNALSKEEKTTIKERSFEPLVDKDEEPNSCQAKTPQFFALQASHLRGTRQETTPRDSSFHSHGQQSLDVKENSNTNPFTFMTPKPERLFFSQRSNLKKTLSMHSANSNKFKPSPLLTSVGVLPSGDKLQVKFNVLNKKTLDHNDSKSHIEALSLDPGEENQNYNYSLSKKESFSRGNRESESPPPFQEIIGEPLLKEGVPYDIQKLFQALDMYNVPSISFPYTVEQLANAFSNTFHLKYTNSLSLNSSKANKNFYRTDLLY